MREETFVEKMKRFGFAEYESKCYLSLFEKEALSVNEITNLTGVPRSSIYGVMKKLLTKGLCVALPGKVTKYVAANPDSLKDNLLESIDESKKIVEDLTSNLETLFNGSRGNGDPLEYIEILKNPSVSHRRFLELSNQTQREMLGFVKAPFIHRAGAEAMDLKNEQHTSNFGAIKRGVAQRSMWEFDAVKHELVPFFKKYWRNYSGMTRVTERLPVKMVVFDRQFVLYQLEDPVPGKPSLTSLVTKHRALAEAFVGLFEYHWEKGIPLEEFLATEGIINTDDKKQN